MKKFILPVILCMALLLSACGAGQTSSSAPDNGDRQIEEIPTAGGETQSTTGETQTATGEIQTSTGETQAASGENTTSTGETQSTTGETEAAGENTTTAEATEAAAGEDASTSEENQAANDDTSAASGSTGNRQDGERFEDTIMLEGMEETVKYEHAVNDSIGFEIDYDYESLARNRGSDKERFISIYDDASKPYNYLEVTYRSESADSVTSSLSAELSKEYDVTKGSSVLAGGSTCTTLNATSGLGGTITESLQKVYIIPAGNGSVVATAHYTFEAAEGFGHRFDYMMNTLVVTDSDH